MSEEVALVKEELAQKQQALEALQRNFDDFQESSRELEEELEAELGRTQDQVSELTSRLAEVAERLGEQQAKNRAISGEARVAVAQAETARLKAAAVRAAAEKTSLEQAADELEAKCRAAVAAEEDSRHKLDLAIEEKIFVSNDLEDLRAESLRTERQLRSDVDDLRQELGRLRSNNNSGSDAGSGATTTRTPPEMALRRQVSSLSDATLCAGGPDANEDTATMIDGDELLLSVDARLETGAGLDDGAGIADELIKARYTTRLKTELLHAESANDELNVELQLLQEMELARRTGGTGESAAGASLNEEGVRGSNGGGERTESPRTLAEQAALKQDLADAMATCEELDQTVTDLTDDLHAKDQQRHVLETRLAELEAELGSKTQSLEDQVLEAKTNASSLTAKLADTTAELRASNSRVEDVTAKAASLREQLSELTSTVSDISDQLREREAQLEEAQATAEELQAELSGLQKSVETLSAKLAEDGAARKLAETTAAEREERLRRELQEAKDNAAAAKAKAAAAAAAANSGPLESPSRGQDPELTVVVRSDGGKTLEAAGGRSQREGQSSGEPAAGRGNGNNASGTANAGDREAAVSFAATGEKEEDEAGRASGSERELQEQVARLKVALEEAQRRGGGGGPAAGIDGKESAVSSALESGDVDALKTELRNVTQLYSKERGMNASLLSKIRALRGNIEVICRIRPPTADETASGVPMALEALGEGEIGVKTSSRHGGGGGASSWRSFALDKALGPSTTQEEVFRQVEPLALSAADGMNACIFAYGQTGSGKTHTMIGDAKGGEMAGISYRTMNKLFQVLELRQRQQPDYVFTVKVAMLEIYNEDVRDLLSDPLPSGSGGVGGGGSSSTGGDGAVDGSKLEIRRDQDGMVQVPGLTQVEVTSAKEVLTLLERGGGARAVAATGVHDDSSRSHSVLLAEVACRAGPDALPATGRLFLVDLAGSERIKVSGVTGVGLREATNINSSLSALGDVMQALDQKQKHVPYRNSKLTFLLQDALGGNSRTAMVVTVCPTTLNVDETLFALQFATRARNISLGPAHKNVGAKNLLEEGKDLRAKLREAGRKKEHAEEALATLQREHARSQQKMGALLESRVKNVGDLRQQLEYQISSLKSQLEASQATVLAERSKRAALQAETEDNQRQLKRSMAKVTALGRDREEREAKLRAKQEEVGELKAELRKAVADAKNAERRINVGGGRGGTGAGGASFGFKPKGGDSGILAPGKGSPHTPSRKLSEAKYRYNRHKQSTPGRRPPSSGGEDAPFLTVSPGLADTSMSVSSSSDVVTARSSTGSSTSEQPPPSSARAGAAREERTGSVFAAAAAAGVSDDAAAGSSAKKAAVANGGASATAAAAAAAAAKEATAGSAQGQNGGGEAAAAHGGAAGSSGADDVADAIARATAVFAVPVPIKGKAAAAGEAGDNGFAKPLPKTASGSGGGKGGGTGGDGKTSGRTARGSGAGSTLMKGTASSTSRLKLSVPSALEENRSGSTPRSASRRPSTGVTPRSTSTPRGFGSGSSRETVPPSPSQSRLARPSSFAVSGRPTTKPKTPRTRSSLSGPVGPAAAAAAAGSVSSRRSSVQPLSPAQGGASGVGAQGGGSGVGAPSSARSITGVGGRKGWLGEKSRGSVSGASGGRGSSAVTPGASTGGGSGVGQRKASGGDGEQLSRAQIALNRHQARMDRIREKREERMGNKEPSS
ncbi:unnamed protein product [Ectocarpus sp. CCAP 1310/34]|nr:unnamed protein product [Ectocarpus sp. CCAP 1310/34]